MEAWRRCWREGVAPLLSDAGLEALRKALAEDDPRLMQGATMSPPPLRCVQGWPVECACLMAYPGWQGDGLTTVGEVEKFFQQRCYEADVVLEEPGGIGWLLNWYDDTPRDEMRAALMPEVEREQSRRREPVAC